MKAGRELDALVEEKVCPKCTSTRRMMLKTGYTQCLDCHNERNRAYQRTKRRMYPYNKTPAFKTYIRTWKLRTRYGLIPQQFDQMRDRQLGLCAICLCLPTSGLCVDHCHVTGKVRGLLCNSCNVGLANFRDNAEALTRAMEYLCATK